MMIATIVRSFLTRSAIKYGPQHASPMSATGSRYLSNVLLGPHRQRRLFSVSTAFASPTPAKTTTAKKSAAKAPAKKKSTVVKRKTVTATASKKKTTVTKKKRAAPKKRKVAAKKRKVTVIRRKAKKVVAPKVTPRNDASLRAPARSMSAFSLYVKRMWPTLSPKPVRAPAGIAHVTTMWKSLTDAERKPFLDEASAITAERNQAYDKWRSGLSLSDVRAINAYRKGTKHAKLGRSAGPKKPIKGWLKFYQEVLKNGTIDTSKAPAGTRPVIYASKEAGKLWKGMSAEQKQHYM